MSFCSECQQIVLSEASFNAMCAKALSCRLCHGESLNARRIMQSISTSTSYDAEEEVFEAPMLFISEDASAEAKAMDAAALEAQLDELKDRECGALKVWKDAARAEKNACAVLEVVRSIQHKLKSKLRGMRETTGATRSKSPPLRVTKGKRKFQRE